MDQGTRDELVAAWEAWDQHPGWEATAGRMVDAVNTAASELGWHPCRLQDALIAARHYGRDHTDAVDVTVEVYEAGETPAW